MNCYRYYSRRARWFLGPTTFIYNQLYLLYFLVFLIYLLHTITLSEECNNHYKQEKSDIKNINQTFYDGKNNKATQEKTEIFHGSEDSNNAILNFVYKTKYRIDACLDSNGPSVMVGIY